MLRMFDAKTAIAAPISLRSLSVDFENLKICFITDGMDHYLQPRFIGRLDPFEHDAFRQHLLEQQTARVRRIVVRFKKIRGRRAETAIGKAFESANPQHIAPKPRAHAGFSQHIPGDNRANSINAGF